MTGLIKSELFKICNKKIFIFGLIAILLYAISNFLPYLIAEGHYPTTAYTDSGDILYGRAAVEYNQSIAAPYKGILDDNKIEEMMKNYKKTDENAIGLFPVNAGSLFLSSFYYNGELHTIAEVCKNITEPLRYGYNDSWGEYLYEMNIIMKMVLCLIMVALASVFSQDYQNGMILIIRTTPKGRNIDTKAKIIASLIVANIGVTFFIVLLSVAYYIFFGIEGWDTSIQVGVVNYFINSPLNINYLTLSVEEIILNIVVVNCVSIGSLLISYITKNNYVSIIICLALFFFPNMPILTRLGSTSSAGRILAFFPYHAVNAQMISGCRPIKIHGFQIQMFPILVMYYIIISIVMSIILLKMARK